MWLHSCFAVSVMLGVLIMKYNRRLVSVIIIIMQVSCPFIHCRFSLSGIVSLFW